MPDYKTIMNIRKRLEQARLYTFTPDKYANDRDILQIVKQEIAGGADIIQLREKNISDREKLQLAIALRKLTNISKVLFIVNDDVDIAFLSNADGVHLGQDDIPVSYARKILKKEQIIGISTHNMEQFKSVQNDNNIDYVAIGPIFPTSTKDNPAPFIGIEKVNEIIKFKNKKVVGIGGINYENLDKVISTGIDCVAIVSDIVKAKDITSKTLAIKKKIVSIYSQLT